MTAILICDIPIADLERFSCYRLTEYADGYYLISGFEDEYNEVQIPTNTIKRLIRDGILVHEIVA